MLEGMQCFYDVLMARNNMIPPGIETRRDLARVTLEIGWEFIFQHENNGFAIQPIGPSGKGKIYSLGWDDEEGFKKILDDLGV